MEHFWVNPFKEEKQIGTTKAKCLSVYHIQSASSAKSKGMGGDGRYCDLICLSNLDSDNEWIAKHENSTLPMDNSWMDIHKVFAAENGSPKKWNKRGDTYLNICILFCLFYYTNHNGSTIY